MWSLMLVELDGIFQCWNQTCYYGNTEAHWQCQSIFESITRFFYKQHFHKQRQAEIGDENEDENEK